MTNNNQFTIEHAENAIQRSKKIGSNDAYVRGVREAEVTYACGHRWIACEGNCRGALEQDMTWPQAVFRVPT